MLTDSKGISWQKVRYPRGPRKSNQELEHFRELRWPPLSFVSSFWLHFEVETKAQVGAWLVWEQQPIRSRATSGPGALRVRALEVGS